MAGIKGNQNKSSQDMLTTKIPDSVPVIAPVIGALFDILPMITAISYTSYDLHRAE